MGATDAYARVYDRRMLNTHTINVSDQNGRNMLARLLYGIKITDEATCYKVFKAEILKALKLESVGFEFCPEVTAKISKAGYKIFEVSISYSPRSTEHGKKVSWRDGLIAIKTLLKYRIID